MTEDVAEAGAGPIPLVDLRAQHASLREELGAAVASVFERGDFILGEDVSRFENELAAWLGVRHVVGVGSGTDALTLALTATGVGDGDEVIVPAMTFAATALAVTAVGATPVFADVDAQSLTLTARGVAEHVGPRTRAIIPVHLHGHPADMDAIGGVADAGDLVVIEDACQAHGARWRGRRVGGFGDAAAFSFYPGKNLGGWGDGGAVATSDDEIAESIRRARDYGRTDRYLHAVPGGRNSRLDSLQAAILRVKLRHLERWNQARCRLASLYTERLSGLPGVRLPPVHACASPVWHLYCLRVAEGRDELLATLHEAGIGAAIHYPRPLHLQPCFESLGLGPGAAPVAEQAARELISLPMFPEMSDEQLGTVVDVVRRGRRAYLGWGG